MYDQTGSADGQPDPGFNPNPNGNYNPGYGQSFHGFNGNPNQNFDPNAFNQFRSSFNGFNTGQRGNVGGF